MCDGTHLHVDNTAQLCVHYNLHHLTFETINTCPPLLFYPPVSPCHDSRVVAEAADSVYLDSCAGFADDVIPLPGHSLV